MQKRKLKVKGIILDLDGTIVDSREAYLEALNTAFASTEQESFDIKTVTEIPRRLEQNLPINNMTRGINTRKFLDAYLKSFYKATATKTKPIPNVSETLENLCRRVKLALITMRHVPREEIIRELQKFNLAKYFQLVVTALDTYHPKPSPEALMKCVEHFGIRVSECAVVGDSVADVRAGKNAGAKTVAVLSGIFTKEELEKQKPNLILKNINELPDFVEPTSK